MAEEIDFSKLSVEDRCAHKAWKARVSGYEESAKIFELQDDEKSPEYNKYLGLVKKFVVDSNAIAQEKGLVAVLAFVTNAACATKTANDIMSALVTKCFSSPRTRTRELALEIALMYVEIEKQDVVCEELIKGFSNKSPKVVSSCIVALREALHVFGMQVILIKPIIKELPKLLEDRDQGVRGEAKQMYVELYRWVGEAIKPQPTVVKPVTISELEKEFEKVAGERIAPTRYLKSQKEKMVKCKENAEVSEDNSAEALPPPPPQVDPYDLMTAVDVISKLPKNFYEQIEAKKWQERKEVLENLLQLTTNVKLESGDYGDLVRALKKCVSKDSNVVVVAIAIKCLTALVVGLRKKFQPYTSACIPAIFEKFKEKKQNVVIALRECIDALYSISTFEAMLEDIQGSLDSKNPQIKAETCAFLTRAFSICPASQLNKKILKAFTESLLKTLNDTDATVRDNSAEAIGTAYKLVGERVMNQFLQGVDAIKMAKIKEYCDKAEVVAQPQVAVEKKTVSAPAKPAIVKKEEPTSKPISAGIKKPTPAGPVKSKAGSSGARAVRPGATKKTPVDTGEPEYKESDLSEEDVLTQASEVLTEDVINGLASSNWKDRLAACENFLKAIQAMEKGSLPGQCLVKVLSKKPGFKDNNFQILKLRFEILAYIAENAKISQITVEHCLSDIVDKIGDVKNGTYAGLALTAFAEATSLEYISLAVLNLAFAQKNPKNLSESLIWLSAAIKQFGLKIQVKEVVDYLKKGFASTNPAVRNAALALLGTMYLYIGKPLRTFFEDEKQALLQQIDAEFEKMKDAKPPAPEKGKAVKNDGSGDASENVNFQVNLSDLIPRVDISSQITSQLLSELSDKDWHLRSDALQKISNIISEAKFITPNLGELPIALKPRLTDTNKRLALQALSICQMLGTSLGPQCSKQIRNFVPGILACLGDNKPNVRTAAIQCLNAWIDNCPLTNLFEGEMLADALKPENPFLRAELFSWLTEKMPTVNSLPSSELALCLPVLLTCLEDRNSEVRKKASECLLPFMMHVGFEPMARAASKLKPASKNTVIAQLEKVRQTLPPKAATVAKPKQGKGVTPASNERSSPPQATANEEGTKSKMVRSTSKPKLALKPPSTGVAKGKKEEEIDTSPSLVANNMKDQRMADEKALKVLKWNFTNPREEFYVQLKDQMTAANWSATLIAHCFHNDFKFHIKAIDLLIESLNNGVEASAANFDLVVKWLALRFFDTNPSVLIKSLEYLQALLHALTAVNYRMLELEASSFIPYLIMKIGDPKDAVRKGVREIIKTISRIYPYSKMFSYIMQGLASKNARQRAECLEELESMIETYGLNVCQPSPQVALREIAKQISDRDNGVRNAALNCIVQAYYIEGEKVYKTVGQLTDKNLGLLEERIKRASKTRKVKPVESNLPSAKASPPAPANTSYSVVQEDLRVAPSPAAMSRRSGPLKLETDDIEQMFRSKEPDVQFPGLVQVNADEILNLPDIQLPRTRMRPPATSLKILNSTDDVETCVNIVMSQLAAQDIPVVMQAFAQIEEVLKKSDQALTVLDSRVDQLLVMGALQYRYAFNKHMADETICKADVVSLYRCVTLALVALFDNPVLSKKASRDVLRDLIPHLITVMLDNRLDELQEGAHVVKIINVLIMRILQKGNPTHVLSALIKLLYDSVGSVNVSKRFTDLVMKCLWKMIRMIHQVIHEMNIDRILLDIHVFLKTYPSSSWKERADDTPIRTIKTILFKFVEIKNEDIMKHLSLISDRQESDLVNYLHKVLAKRKDDNRKSSNKNAVAMDNDGNIRHKRCKSSPLKLSKSTHEALTEIFRKIGCKDQTKEGLSELYDFTQNHPEADIEPYLKNSSDFFQNYIRQGIQQLEKEKGNSNQASPLGSGMKSEEGWNSNLAGKNLSFTKDKTTSRLWEEKFPPLPPCTVDTTPMDYVEWLKNVVARLGMDTSKYDDPAFLDKITGNGNSGPLSEEEMSKMNMDIERYRKIIDDLRNAA